MAIANLSFQTALPYPSRRGTSLRGPCLYSSLPHSQVAGISSIFTSVRSFRWSSSFSTFLPEQLEGDYYRCSHCCRRHYDVYITFTQPRRTASDPLDQSPCQTK